MNQVTFANSQESFKHLLDLEGQKTRLAQIQTVITTAEITATITDDPNSPLPLQKLSLDTVPEILRTDPYCQETKQLDLSHNNLEVLPDWLFSELRFLKTLDLSNNPLKSFNVFLLRNLPTGCTVDLRNTLLNEEIIQQCKKMRSSTLIILLSEADKTASDTKAASAATLVASNSQKKNPLLEKEKRRTYTVDKTDSRARELANTVDAFHDDCARLLEEQKEKNRHFCCTLF
ncbi:MAG: leucine-rich repeat domain-containing protein [Chlamydiae bacterium]|nr:leucine-rich repeat domain-containing protein [Chlamydiota bacterium]